MLGGAVQTINGALAQPLLAADRESVVARQITGTAIVFLILNAIVIPKLGAMGAAWVYVGSVTVGTIWLVPGYRKLVNSHGTPPADADE
jgi:O-antigen/teichoic acid export membrane protein